MNWKDWERTREKKLAKQTSAPLSLTVVPIDIKAITSSSIKHLLGVQLINETVPGKWSPR